MVEVNRTLHGLLLSAVYVMLAAFCLEISESHASLSRMSNSSSSSNTWWQGTMRGKQGWNADWKEWDDSTTTESAAPELIPDERIMNALTQGARSPATNHGDFSAAVAKKNVHRASRIKDESECRL